VGYKLPIYICRKTEMGERGCVSLHLQQVRKVKNVGCPHCRSNFRKNFTPNNFPNLSVSEFSPFRITLYAEGLKLC